MPFAETSTPPELNPQPKADRKPNAPPSWSDVVQKKLTEKNREYQANLNIFLDQNNAYEQRVPALRKVVTNRVTKTEDITKIIDALDLNFLRAVCANSEEFTLYTGLYLWPPKIKQHFQELIESEFNSANPDPLIVTFGAANTFLDAIKDANQYLQFFKNLSDFQIGIMAESIPSSLAIIVNFLEGQDLLEFLERDNYDIDLEALLHILTKLYFINHQPLINLFFDKFLNYYKDKPYPLSVDFQCLETKNIYPPALKMMAGRILEFFGLDPKKTERLLERFVAAEPYMEKGKYLPRQTVEKRAYSKNMAAVLDFIDSWIDQDNKELVAKSNPLQLALKSGISIFARHEAKTIISNIFATHGENLDPKKLIGRKAVIFYVDPDDNNGALSRLSESRKFIKKLKQASPNIDPIVVDGPLANLVITMGRQRTLRNRGTTNPKHKKPWVAGIIWNAHGLPDSVGGINEQILKQYKKDPNRNLTADAPIILYTCLTGFQVLDPATNQLIPPISDHFAQTLQRTVLAPEKEILPLEGYQIKATTPGSQSSSGIEITPDFRHVDIDPQSKLPKEISIPYRTSKPQIENTS